MPNIPAGFEIESEPTATIPEGFEIESAPQPADDSAFRMQPSLGSFLPYVHKGKPDTTQLEAQADADAAKLWGEIQARQAQAAPGGITPAGSGELAAGLGNPQSLDQLRSVVRSSRGLPSNLPEESTLAALGRGWRGGSLRLVGGLFQDQAMIDQARREDEEAARTKQTGWLASSLAGAGPMVAAIAASRGRVLPAVTSGVGINPAIVNRLAPATITAAEIGGASLAQNVADRTQTPAEAILNAAIEAGTTRLGGAAEPFLPVARGATARSAADAIEAALSDPALRAGALRLAKEAGEEGLAGGSQSVVSQTLGQGNEPFSLRQALEDAGKGAAVGSVMAGAGQASEIASDAAAGAENGARITRVEQALEALRALGGDVPQAATADPITVDARTAAIGRDIAEVIGPDESAREAATQAQEAARANDAAARRQRLLNSLGDEAASISADRQAGMESLEKSQAEAERRRQLTAIADDAAANLQDRKAAMDRLAEMELEAERQKQVRQIVDRQLEPSPGDAERIVAEGRQPDAAPTITDEKRRADTLEQVRQEVDQRHQLRLAAINARRQAGEIGKPQAAQEKAASERQRLAEYGEAAQAVAEGAPLPAWSALSPTPAPEASNAPNQASGPGVAPGPVPVPGPANGAIPQPAPAAPAAGTAEAAAPQAPVAPAVQRVARVVPVPNGTGYRVAMRVGNGPVRFMREGQAPGSAAEATVFPTATAAEQAANAATGRRWNIGQSDAAARQEAQRLRDEEMQRAEDEAGARAINDVEGRARAILRRFPDATHYDLLREMSDYGFRVDKSQAIPPGADTKGLRLRQELARRGEDVRGMFERIKATETRNAPQPAQGPVPAPTPRDVAPMEAGNTAPRTDQPAAAPNGGEAQASVPDQGGTVETSSISDRPGNNVTAEVTPANGGTGMTEDQAAAPYEYDAPFRVTPAARNLTGDAFGQVGKARVGELRAKADAFVGFFSSLSRGSVSYEVMPTQGLVRISLPSGRSFFFRPVESIPMTQAAIDEARQAGAVKPGETPMAAGVVLTLADGQKLVQIARDLGKDDAQGTAWHEAVHLSRGLGLLNDAEWSALTKRFPALKADPEEAVARGVESWTPPAGIARRIRQMLARLGNWMRRAKLSAYVPGLGQEFNAEALAEDIQTGRVMLRDAGQGGSGGGFKIAYHGTGNTNRYDRFSTEKIGTGTGRRIHGWGLYFTNREEIAKHYRDNFKRHGESGRVYTVDIPEEAELLKWNAILSEQPETVRALVDKYINGAPSQMTGADIYRDFGEIAKTDTRFAAMERDEAASRWLAERGVPGSTFVGIDGSQNYVIFDDSRVQIKDAYSIKGKAADTIDVDGVQRWRTNSDGNPIHPTEDGIRNFWRWFGDSKVVDEQGRPLVVYHGSPKSFDVFDTKKIGQAHGRSEGAGFYFTTDQQTAKGYAEGGEPMELYLRIEKPIEYGMPGFKAAQVKRLVLEASKIEAQDDGADQRDGFLSNFGDTYSIGVQNAATEAAKLIAADEKAVDQLGGLVGSGLSADTVNRALKNSLGYDGYVSRGFSGAGDAGGVIWVATDPTQAKSATGNLGTFDPADPRIGYKIQGIPKRAPTGTETGRPDLANPAENEDARQFVTNARAGMEAAGEPGTRDWDTVAKEADSLLAANKQGEQARVLGMAKASEMLRDTDVVIAKRMIDEVAADALRGGDPIAERKALDLVVGYTRGGTETARALAIRRDPLQTPEERIRSTVVTALYTPPQRVMNAIGKKLDEAQKAETSPEQRQELEKQIERMKRQHLARIEKIKSQLKRMGIDIEDVQGLASNPRKAAAAIPEIQAAKADNWDAAYEWWISSILSGPKTQIANISGNTINGLLLYGIEKPLRAALNLATGGGNAESFTELSHLYRGAGPGLVRASRNFINAFRTERARLEEEVLGKDFLGANQGEKRGPSISGTKGRIIRIPLRLLLATDEFFKSFIAQMEVGAQAHRRGKAMGLNGSELDSHIRSETQNMQSQAWVDAIQEAKKATFQNDNAVADAVSGLREKVPGARYILPFIKTPTNIFARGASLTPLGAINVARKLVQGLVHRASPESMIAREYARSEVISDVVSAVAGTAAMVAIMGAMGDDDEPWITGSQPAGNPGERELNQRAAPPFSIKVGDEWYSYGRLEPLATAIGGLVDAAKIMRSRPEEGRSKAAKIMGAVTEQVKNKTFLKTVGDIVDILTDQTRSASELADVARGIAVGFVPNVIRQGVAANEDTIKESRPFAQPWTSAWWGEQGRTAAGQAAAGVPFLPKVDLWGREIEKGDGMSPETDFLFRLLSPMDSRPDTATVYDRALLAWNAGPGKPAYPRMPTNYIRRKDGSRWYFTPEQYRDFLVTRGKTALQLLGNWKPQDPSNPKPIEIERIKRAITAAGKRAIRPYKIEAMKRGDVAEDDE